MKLKKITLLFLLFLSSFTGLKTVAQGLTDEVYVDKVAYCRAAWPICNDRTRSDYKLWEDHGVPDQAQKETYIGKYNIPKPDFVKNIVFLTSGQRSVPGIGFIDKFLENLVTGQGDFSPFGKQVSGKWRTISQNSLAYEMFDRGIYSLDDTFAALAFDARFNWGFSSSNKRKIVNAYYDWLKSKASDMSQVESVYLGGHSRGGALVLRLAKKFKDEFPQLKVIVHAIDPVPNRGQRELGASSQSYITSPLNSDYFAWNSYFENEFTNTDNLSIYNVLSGDQAVDGLDPIIIGAAGSVLLGPPAGAAVGAVTELIFNNTADGTRAAGQAGSRGQVMFELEDWYTQQWINSGHQGIANNGRVVNLLLDHLEFELNDTKLKGAQAIFNLMMSD